jgi:hypothetical protein
MTRATLSLVGQTLDESVESIHRKFAEAFDSDKKGNRARLAAGTMLLNLRSRIESGEAGDGISWWAWYESKFVRSRRDAEKVMALAASDDPVAADEDEKQRNRTAQQKHRDAADVSRDDVVKDALNLVASMDEEQLARFDVAYMEKYHG